MCKIIVAAVLVMAASVLAFIPFIGVKAEEGSASYSGGAVYTEDTWVEIQAEEILYLSSGTPYRVCPESPVGSGGHDFCERVMSGEWWVVGPKNVFLQPLGGVLQTVSVGPGIYPDPTMDPVEEPLPTPEPTPTPEEDDEEYFVFIPIAFPEANAYAFSPYGD